MHLHPSSFSLLLSVHLSVCPTPRRWPCHRGSGSLPPISRMAGRRPGSVLPVLDGFGEVTQSPGAILGSPPLRFWGGVGPPQL
jgi:hypothetical protein